MPSIIRGGGGGVSSIILRCAGALARVGGNLASVRRHARKTRRRDTIFLIHYATLFGGRTTSLYPLYITIFFTCRPPVVRLSSGNRPPIGDQIRVGGVFLLVGVVRLEALIRVRFFSIYAHTRPFALPSHVCGGRVRVCLGVDRRVPTVLVRREKGKSNRRKHSQKPNPDCINSI